MKNSGMGDKMIGVVLVAVMLAGLGDMLAHVQGTNAVFSGVGLLMSDTYTAAGGGYTTTSN